jgi:hypothetical protein
LLECRPDGRGGFDDIFYPSGSIEMKDHADGRNYREMAQRREIAEEFRDGVTVQAVEFLGQGRSASGRVGLLRLLDSRMVRRSGRAHL